MNKRNAKLSITEFIKRGNKVHNNKYDYSKVEYVNNSTKVCIICPIHGEFWQTPRNHINNKQGCPECGKIMRYNSIKASNKEFIEKARKVHGDKYDYSKVNYTRFNIPVEIICPIHGSFFQKPNYHLNSKGCLKCVKEKMNLLMHDTTNSFIEKARKIHGNKYDYSKVEYVDSKEKVCIICSKHGEFWQRPNDHLNGKGCLKCAHVGTSSSENEIVDFIKSISNCKIIKNSRNIIPPHELDIFIPEYNLGIEFDGLYWHSDIMKNNINYHLDKTIECQKHNIKLIHIFEDEWHLKNNVIKSIISNNMEIYSNIIELKDCKIKEINDKEVIIKFLKENTLYDDYKGDIALGLLNKDEELVSIMMFETIDKNTFTLINYCNKLNSIVYDGESKLFNFFVKKYSPKEIKYYFDRRFPYNSSHDDIGFKLKEIIGPKFYYVHAKKRIASEECDSNYNDYMKIYDCGMLYYVWIYNN